MSEVKGVLRVEDDGRTLIFACPGCGSRHQIWIGNGPGPRWTFDGNYERPTFSPSILVRWNERAVPKVCHSFVRDGQIQFLNDCTHELAGKTVPLDASDL
jgi:Family of unknown function (DUF6527)